MFDNITADILQRVTTDQAWHYRILPFKITGEAFHFYTESQNLNPDLQDELEMLFGKPIHLECMDEDLLKRAIGKYYRKSMGNDDKVVTATVKVSDANFLEALIHEADQIGCSDIHIEPYENRSRVRFRIDGVMLEKYQVEREHYPALVNKVKIKSNLDIAEKRLPQDGRIFYKEKGRKLDIRVSTLPTLHGEKIVMRLLGNTDEFIDIQKLGLKGEALDHYLEGVNKPNGMVLISGPTGSGKTTTLYATLQELNQTTRNIVTIEDPIEYTLEGINQTQLKESIGLNFASAMRTFLRQDPDIMMVGEIRDLDTASMAIRASLTGHLVLSTIHTNSAWGIVARLMDMGVPGYLLADTLNTAVAQRLVRLLCSECKKEKPFDIKYYPRSFKTDVQMDTHFIASGCQTCFYTGYKGRHGVYEVLPIDEDLADLIKAQNLNVKDHLKSRGIQTLAGNAFRLFKNGLTSIEEIYPILASGA